MLSKNDLKLFEILDGCLDKELTEWCIFTSDKTKIYHKITYEWCMKWLYYVRWFDWFIVEKIIWHYPTLSTVLSSLWSCYSWEIYWDELRIRKYLVEWVLYRFDLTKEIKYRTEEAKWELIQFLETNQLKNKWLD